MPLILYVFDKFVFRSGLSSDYSTILLVISRRLVDSIVCYCIMYYIVTVVKNWSRKLQRVPARLVYYARMGDMISVHAVSMVIE